MGGWFVLSGVMDDRLTWAGLPINGPFTDVGSFAGAYIREGSYSEVQAASLGVDEFIWFDSGEIGYVFHDEAVILSLWSYPCFRLDAQVTVNTIEEFPSVC
jgi:hypothetical protein